MHSHGHSQQVGHSHVHLFALPTLPQKRRSLQFRHGWTTAHALVNREELVHTVVESPGVAVIVAGSPMSPNFVFSKLPKK